MGDYLKDPKNTMVVAAGAGVFLILAAMLLMFEFGIIGGKKSSSDENAVNLDTSPTTMAGMPPSPAGGSYPGGPSPAGGYPYPGTGGVPLTGATATPAAAGGKTVKALPPSLPSRKDPFAPLIKPKKVSGPTGPELAAELPPLSIYKPTASSTAANNSAAPGPPPEPEPQRRMVGLVTGRRTYAVIEQQGPNGDEETVTVRTGDVLPDLSRVERIEPTRILLRKGDKAIWVPLRSSTSGNTGGAPGGYPAYPQPSGYPRKGGYGYPPGVYGGGPSAYGGRPGG